MCWRSMRSRAEQSRAGGSDSRAHPAAAPSWLLAPSAAAASSAHGPPPDPPRLPEEQQQQQQELSRRRQGRAGRCTVLLSSSIPARALPPLRPLLLLCPPVCEKKRKEASRGALASRAASDVGSVHMARQKGSRGSNPTSTRGSTATSLDDTIRGPSRVGMVRAAHRRRGERSAQGGRSERRRRRAAASGRQMAAGASSHAQASRPQAQAETLTGPPRSPAAPGSRATAGRLAGSWCAAVCAPAASRRHDGGCSSR